MSCKEFHKENYSLSCTVFAHLARRSSREKKPFVLSEPKTILRKHKFVGFFAKFSYIYTTSYRNAIALHTERQMYVVLFQTLPRATHHF